MKAKNTLKISRQGYDLLDRKRNVLIREILELNETAQKIQSEIDVTFREAYAALQDANIDMGLSNVEIISHGMPHENSVSIKVRSIMGVEIPILKYGKLDVTPNYGFTNTSVSLDSAYLKFNKVKELIIRLSMIENACYRLAVSIKKTQKRANALKNITIPYYEGLTKVITETLEERERDEFTRLKVIKRKSN